MYLQFLIKNLYFKLLVLNLCFKNKVFTINKVILYSVGEDGLEVYIRKDKFLLRLEFLLGTLDNIPD